MWKLADLAQAEDGTRGALSIDELLAMEASNASGPTVPTGGDASASRKTWGPLPLAERGRCRGVLEV